MIRLDDFCDIFQSTFIIIACKTILGSGVLVCEFIRLELYENVQYLEKN